MYRCTHMGGKIYCSEFQTNSEYELLEAWNDMETLVEEGEIVMLTEDVHELATYLEISQDSIEIV